MPLPSRTALLVACSLLLGLPALAHAAPADCLKDSGVGAVLCAVQEGGGAVQQAEAPLVGPRDAVRTGSDTALEAAGICDPSDHAGCLLPFPNDRFTVADPTTATGRRINISPLATPRNVAGKPIDTREWNRNDGWSPGSALLTSVPGVDVAASAIPTIADIGASLSPRAPIVLIDTVTGRRHPYWAELDGQPTGGEQPLLIVRPAVNFTEGHRYVVGLRNLRNRAGNVIPPGAVFAAKAASANGTDPVFGPLARAGIAPKDLYLAWTFTIASTRNNTARMLHIRDDAFASLNGGTPTFTVGAVTDRYSDRIARRVTGTFTLPNYLITPVNHSEPVLGTDPGPPGNGFFYLPGHDLPDRNGSFTATYTCDIPAAASQRPARGAIYGHGLLGGQGEVGADNVAKMGAENDVVYCATDWYGMATGDVPAVATMLTDMSGFPTLADRVQQGMLAQLFLARLMKDPRGFASAPAFSQSGRPLLASGSVYYDGNSQGGIIGGALMAVAQDFTRGVLGVPGMNYSTLLDRSSDFSRYAAVLNAAYPSEVDREILFGLIQMLWDRAEADGYAAHITRDPLPGTPVHQVLMDVAFGDHQVANAAAEVEARTIGVATNPGFVRAGRHWARQPGWAIPRISRFPFAGSALVYWDSGSDTPPNDNVPPRAATRHGDPHEDPRATYLARVQKSAFLWPHGMLVDVCGGRACLARPLGPEDPPAHR